MSKDAVNLTIAKSLTKLSQPSSRDERITSKFITFLSDLDFIGKETKNYVFLYPYSEYNSLYSAMEFYKNVFIELAKYRGNKVVNKTVNSVIIDDRHLVLFYILNREDVDKGIKADRVIHITP